MTLYNELWTPDFNKNALIRDLLSVRYDDEIRFDDWDCPLISGKNDGNDNESIIRFVLTGELTRKRPLDTPDSVIYNRNGAIAATIEFKSGASQLSSKDITIQELGRIRHATHVCYTVKHTKHSMIGNARIVSAKKFYERLCIKGMTRSKKYTDENGNSFRALSMQTILPTPSFSGLKAAREFIDWLYENGETIPEFMERLNIGGIFDIPTL